MTEFVTLAPRILIVEDETTTQQLLTTTLTRVGMSVTVCENAGVGLYQYIQNSPFDAVILDIMMPGVNGDAFLHVAESLLQAGLVVRRSRIIVLTSISNVDQLNLYSNFECVHCVLSKPAPRVDLIRHLEEIVEISRIGSAAACSIGRSNRLEQ